MSVGAIRSKIVYQKVNTWKEKVEWLNIRWFQVSKESPFQVCYRYNHNTLEAWKVFDLRKHRLGRPVDIGRVWLTPLYNTPRYTNIKKLEYLRALMLFIPPVRHAFYNSLESTTREVPEESDTEN